MDRSLGYHRFALQHLAARPQALSDNAFVDDRDPKNGLRSSHPLAFHGAGAGGSVDEGVKEGGWATGRVGGSSSSVHPVNSDEAARACSIAQQVGNGGTGCGAAPRRAASDVRIRTYYYATYYACCASLAERRKRTRSYPCRNDIFGTL